MKVYQPSDVNSERLNKVIAAGEAEHEVTARRAAEAERAKVANEIAGLRAALMRALGVFDWLAENEPDCYGWNPPYPSTSSSIKGEADAIRAALAHLGGRHE